MDESKQPLILVVGAANTGRSPIAAALLRRLVTERGLDWLVESAGVIGYDVDPPEMEARNVMIAFRMDISEHRARSLDPALVEQTTMMLAIDRGIANGIQSLYPNIEPRIVTLGELAGSNRDIPDPFRMQVGVWMVYAREIESLLAQGFERLVAMVEQHSQIASAEPTSTPSNQHDLSKPSPSPLLLPSPPPLSPPPLPTPTPTNASENRAEILARCERLLTFMADMPGLVVWEQARQHLETELTTIDEPLSSDDMIVPYRALLVALLQLWPDAPTPEQITLLREALERMHMPIDTQAMMRFSVLVTRWRLP